FSCSYYLRNSNKTTSSQIYTLPLHDALPIFVQTLYRNMLCCLGIFGQKEIHITDQFPLIVFLTRRYQPKICCPCQALPMFLTADSIFLTIKGVRSTHI